MAGIGDLKGYAIAVGALAVVDMTKNIVTS